MKLRLSVREAELLGQLVTRSDTHRIAQQMFVSEHTVQDHLKSIFAKTATRTAERCWPEPLVADRVKRV